MYPDYCMSRYHCIAALVVVTSVLVLNSARAAESDMILRKVFADWRARQTAFSSIKIIAKGEGFVPKGAYTALMIDADPEMEHPGEVPRSDYDYEAELTMLVDFDRNWVRREVRGFRVAAKKPTLFYPHYEITLFDGSGLQVYLPREKNTSSVHSPGQLDVELRLKADGYSRHFFQMTDWPVLFAFGIVKTKNVSLRPQKIRIPLDETFFLVHGRGQNNDRNQVILRTPSTSSDGNSYHEYWVDVQMESAVTRWKAINGGKVEYRCDAEYERVAEAWLPKSWTFVEYWQESIMRSTTLTVVDMIPNAKLQKQEFQIAPVAGMVVADEKAKTAYIIGEDEQRKDLASARRRARAQNSKHSLTWYYSAGIVCAITMIGVAVWRMRLRAVR